MGYVQSARIKATCHLFPLRVFSKPTSAWKYACPCSMSMALSAMAFDRTGGDPTDARNHDSSIKFPTKFSSLSQDDQTMNLGFVESICDPLPSNKNNVYVSRYRHRRGTYRKPLFAHAFCLRSLSFCRYCVGFYKLRRMSCAFVREGHFIRGFIVNF